MERESKHGGMKMDANTDFGIETLQTHCAKHGIDLPRARRAARRGEYGGAFKLFPTDKTSPWVIAVDHAPTVLPDAKSRGKSRDDGRSRWIVYATDMEHMALLNADAVPSDCWVDPRERARERREHKRELDENAVAIAADNI